MHVLPLQLCIFIDCLNDLISGITFECNNIEEDLFSCWDKSRQLVQSIIDCWSAIASMHLIRDKLFTETRHFNCL